MKKSELVDLLRNLPEEFDVEELLHRIRLAQKLAAAEAAAQRGRVLTHAEVVRRSDEWSK